MKKYTPLFCFLASLLSVGIGYVLDKSYEFNLCFSNIETETFDVSCHAFYRNIGDPLLYGMGALAIVFAVLLVFPVAFNAWRNFALWFLPPVIDIFATYEGPGNGFMDFTPYPVEVYRWLGQLYIGLSVAIIAVSVLRRKFGRPSAPRVPSKTRQIVFWTVWICYVTVIIGWHFFD